MVDAAEIVAKAGEPTKLPDPNNQTDNTAAKQKQSPKPWSAVQQMLLGGSNQTAGPQQPNPWNKAAPKQKHILEPWSTMLFANGG